ncbi:hypothetical protein [Pyrococcus yayanosii]|uniref:hypothetical protein n=1 Tax=Pyrococcus yayanosii TaxID=1008460 RepID=UPI00064F433D|nr:hypothetical protein [Pyrococcus yayanosii]
MKRKDIISGILIAFGLVLTVTGFLKAEVRWENLGLAAVILGLVVATIKPSNLVKAETASLLLSGYHETMTNLLRGLSLEGNAVYLPPYGNLPKGGLFVPLREDFDLDPARLSEDEPFVTNVPTEKQMGLLLKPPGAELLEKFEEHLEGPVTSIAELEGAAGAVLKTLGLADRVYIEEGEETIKIIIQPQQCHFSEACTKVACPICSSILLGLTKATGNVITVGAIEKKDYGIEIMARKLGGIEKWM